jgi:hypothetical protein
MKVGLIIMTSSQQGYANNTTNTNLNLWNKMCLATDLLHATLPLGGFSLGIAPSFPPPQKPSPGLLVPPCAEGVSTSTFFQTTAQTGSECLHTQKKICKLNNSAIFST